MKYKYSKEKAKKVLDKFEQGGFMTDPNFGDFQSGVYANGGATKNYIGRNELNTITIKKGDQKLTYKVSDVYNGAYKLESGGKLEKTAFYVSKRNVVKVQLKNGKDLKVANGYWIKKGAKPIRVSKFEQGGFMTDPNFGDFQSGVYAEKGAEVDNQFNYMMLGRLQNDCNYYLGYGNRNEKVLWAGNVDDHIAKMKKLWNNLPKNGKPEWLTMEGILDYEKKMKSDNDATGGQLEMKLAKGGEVKFVDWEKYPTKKVLGFFNVKGKNIDKDINLVMFERYDDLTYDLYPTDTDKKYFRKINVKSTALNSISKGLAVKGINEKSEVVTIKRLKDLSFENGGSTKRGGAMVLAKLIKKEERKKKRRK